MHEFIHKYVFPILLTVTKEAHQVSMMYFGKQSYLRKQTSQLTKEFDYSLRFIL